MESGGIFGFQIQIQSQMHLLNLIIIFHLLQITNAYK